MRVCTNSVEIPKGVIQGCSLLPLFFYLYREWFAIEAENKVRDFIIQGNEVCKRHCRIGEIRKRISEYDWYVSGINLKHTEYMDG